MFCHICGEEINYNRWCEFVRYHVKKVHNIQMSIIEYYNKFMKKDNEGKCKICGKSTSFATPELGYNRFCSGACSNQDPELKKIQSEKRTDYFNNLTEEKSNKRNQKLKDKWKERDVKSMVDKIKSTKLEKYGYETYNNPEQISKSMRGL